jgi:hypothetical protein
MPVKRNLDLLQYRQWERQQQSSVSLALRQQLPLGRVNGLKEKNMVCFKKPQIIWVLAIFFSVVSITQGDVAKPASKTLRVFTAGNSFHYWLPDWLAPIEKAAGINPHEQIGVSYIGGSWVKQHWDANDDSHKARAVVESGKLDVLTLGGMHTPDDGIDKFAAAALEHNPDIIVTFQEFWLPYDRLDWENRNFFGDLTKSLRTWENATDTTRNPHDTSNFNIPTADQIDKLHQPYFDGIDKYISGENGKFKKRVIRMVPVGQAVNALRRKVIAGEVPAISKQSDLFIDALGHPGDAIRALSGYCHFIVIYHKNPKGLPLADFPFLKKDSRFDQPCNLMLEDLAWDAVIHHPLSGFYHEKEE